MSAERPEDHQTTVLVRGETIREPEAKAPPPGEDKGGQQPPKKELSEAKLQMQHRLPALDDDHDIGIERGHTVVRDGKADLEFTGTLLASAAPTAAPTGRWQEYRIYATTGGKHVFSKVTRNVVADTPDAHEAEVFDPAPSSMPSQLLRSARDLTRSRPMDWADAAVAFFGYDPLAKSLYKKFDGQFEEHIA
jgi:hypothetical protein